MALNGFKSIMNTDCMPWKNKKDKSKIQQKVICQTLLQIIHIMSKHAHEQKQEADGWRRKTDTC